jgi:hypothetical protein
MYFTLISSTPSVTLPFPFPSPFFNSFQYVYLLPSQMLCIMILLTLYHALFLPSFSKFHSVVSLLHTCFHICLYMVMFVFVYMFIFWIYLPHLSENMWPLSFWTWLSSPNMMSFNCIHLPEWQTLKWTQSSGSFPLSLKYFCIFPSLINTTYPNLPLLKW